MTGQANDQSGNLNSGQRRPAAATDGPVQTRENDEAATPERQIAQNPQHSTGQGSGQS